MFAGVCYAYPEPEEGYPVKLSKATVWLKGVLALSALVLGWATFVGVPAFMQHVTDVRPDLAGWDYVMRGYGLLMALPVWAVMALLWRVLDTIPRNEPFCAENVKRFRLVARLAVADLALALALALFLVISGVLPPFLVLCLTGALYLGVVAAIVFHVLAGLLQNAVALRQDSELTI